MNAIISAATGYTEADLHPFLNSVGRACQDSKVFLIVYKRDAPQIQKLTAQFSFVEPVYVPHKFNRGGKVYRWIAQHFIDEDYLTSDRFWKKLGRYSLNIMLERFYLALELIQAYRNSFTKVLLTDSRDVIIQHDPFEQIGNSLVTGLEEKTIGECSMNSDWITHVYGTEVHASMSARRIICAGVTLGPASEIEKYLVGMCAEIWKRLSKVALIAQYDQGIHNYLIYSGSINAELVDNRSGIVATLHYEHPNNIGTDPVAGVVTVHGITPAIVHQYDRHRNILCFVREKLAA